MLLKLLRYVMLTLIMLLVFLASALIAMRYAIRGREVSVPALVGLTAGEADRVANASGVVLSVESRFYSPLPQGHIVSQMPVAGAHVRRGWRIMVAESLGPQRVSIPSVIGQSQHAAEINITRRGLEIGSIATIHLPDAQGGTVLAQNPSPNNKEAASPKVSLLLSATDNAPFYVMPSFVGKPLTNVSDSLDRAGFKVGKVANVAGDPTQRGQGTIIVRQYPAAGQKVAAGSTINFDVSQ